MKTNCTCKDRDEEWSFESELGCWYVIRNCDRCQYYWEGPDHSKTNRNAVPQFGIITSIDIDEPLESLRNRQGEFHIYCYDEAGNYGLPVKFDEAQDIFQFCELNKSSHHRIRVITSDDEVTISVVAGKYEFPSNWLIYNT